MRFLATTIIAAATFADVAARADEPDPGAAPKKEPPVVIVEGQRARKYDAEGREITPDARAQPREQTYEPPSDSKPRVVPYEGGPIPKGAKLETRVNWVITGVGIGVFSGFYLTSLFYALGTCGAMMACRPGSEYLYIPVVGPFITAGLAPTTGGAALSVFDGVVQTVSFAMIFAGFVFPKTVVVMYDTARLRAEPIHIPGGAGIGVTVENF